MFIFLIGFLERNNLSYYNIFSHKQLTDLYYSKKTSFSLGLVISILTVKEMGCSHFATLLFIESNGTADFVTKLLNLPTPNAY